MNTFLKGHFKCFVLNPQQEIIQETEWISNDILDAGLSALNTILPGREFARIFIGTGNQEVQPSDSALTFILPAVYQRYEDISAEYSNQSAYREQENTYTTSRMIAARFGQFKEGRNIAEVGLGWESGHEKILLTRALIKNHLGQPVAVSVPKNHYFILVYEFQQLLRNGDISAAVTFNQDGQSAPVQVTQRLFKAGHSDYGLYPVQSLRVNRVFVGTSALMSATESNPNLAQVSSFQLKQTQAGAQTDIQIIFNANDPHVPQSFNLLALETSRGAYQFHFNPPLQKTALQNMTFNFRVQCTREASA